MKKAKLVLIVLVFSLILCGCISKSDYDALEKRIENIENIIMNEQKEIKTENDDLHNEVKSDEEKEQPLYSSSHDDLKQPLIVYPIDDMSEQEIVKECEYYFNNLPFKGESYEEYRKTMKVAPIESNDTGEENTCFVFVNDLYGVSDEDYIRTIRVDGLLTQMDGTIGFPEEMPIVFVNIEMIIHNYEKAANVYGLLFEQLSPRFNSASEKEQSVLDSRESTHWYAQGQITITDHSTMGSVFLDMSRNGDYYFISAKSYTKLDM